MSSTQQTTNGRVWPELPLALLEAVRDQDRPVEILEAEDLSASLPRRFGLSGVVSSQIQRYEAAVSAGTRVPVTELVSLLQLVLRRPDGSTIVREMGRRVTRQRVGERVPFSARLVRRSATLVFGPIRRRAKRLLRGMIGSGRLEMAGKPLTVRITPAFTADLGSGACVLFTGALEELIRIYSGKERRVVHSSCTAQGDTSCEWSVED
ncbi:MAG TPA: hypothetical protein VMM79_08660 [Longimicrobiales bacterium]|nr:hypothetical protein [Longimicrobiales bacterium]